MSGVANRPAKDRAGSTAIETESVKKYRDRLTGLWTRMEAVRGCINSIRVNN